MSIFKRIVSSKTQDSAQKVDVKSSNCPYCNHELSEKPSRKKKCPNCGNYIYVRKGRLLTEEDSKIEDWITRVESLGITKKYFIDQREKLSKEFGKQASVNDTAWRILNLLVTKKLKLFDLKVIYLEMAHIASTEGKNTKPYILEAAKYDLLNYKEMGVKKVKITNCNDQHFCEECRKLQDKVFTVTQALKDYPIPNKCKNPTGCRCWYVAE